MENVNRVDVHEDNQLTVVYDTGVERESRKEEGTTLVDQLYMTELWAGPDFALGQGREGEDDDPQENDREQPDPAAGALRTADRRPAVTDEAA